MVSSLLPRLPGPDHSPAHAAPLQTIYWVLQICIVFPTSSVYLRIDLHGFLYEIILHENDTLVDE